MPGGDADRLDGLLEELEAEFPGFRIIRKSDSPLHRAIHYGLVAITFGSMRSYLRSYQTTIRKTIYVTPDWEEQHRDDRYVTLRHERIHLRQFRRYTLPGMALLYVLVPLPMGVSCFRAHFEKQAYEESIRAAAEVYGYEFVTRPSYRDAILGQFTGAAYGWMWPFRRNLESWYNRVLAQLR